MPVNSKTQFLFLIVVDREEVSEEDVSSPRRNMSIPLTTFGSGRLEWHDAKNTSVLILRVMRVEIDRLRSSSKLPA